MKTQMKEPADKADEGKNKAAAGCAMVVVGAALIGIILYGLWVIVSL